MSSPVLPASSVAPLAGATLSPSSPARKDDSPSPDLLSSFPSPGRGVFSLPYQAFYVQQAREMQQGREKKVKEKKVRKKVEREWEKHASASALDLPSPAQLEDTAATNGHEDGTKPASSGGDGTVHGKHQFLGREGGGAE